jgi:hypothetical protein
MSGAVGSKPALIRSGLAGFLRALQFFGEFFLADDFDGALRM